MSLLMFSSQTCPFPISPSSVLPAPHLGCGQGCYVAFGGGDYVAEIWPEVAQAQLGAETADEEDLAGVD